MLQSVYSEDQHSLIYSKEFGFENFPSSLQNESINSGLRATLHLCLKLKLEGMSSCSDPGVVMIKAGGRTLGINLAMSPAQRRYCDEVTTTDPPRDEQHFTRETCHIQ